MRFKRFSMLTAVLVLLSIVLVGCSPVKSAWVATRVGTAIKRSPISETTGTLHGEIRGKTMGLDSKSALDFTFTSKMDDKNLESHTAVDTTVNVLGLDVKQKFEVYTLKEGEESALYVHVKQPDLWARAASSFDFSKLTNLDPALILMLAERASSNAELTVVEENGVQIYEMSLTFQAKDLMQVLNTAGARVPKEIKDLELSEVSIPVILRVNGETFLPEGLSLEILGLTGPVLEGIFEAAGRDLGGVEIAEGSLTLQFTEFGYGQQQIPSLPAGAKDSAASLLEIQKLFRELFQ